MEINDRVYGKITINEPVLIELINFLDIMNSYDTILCNELLILTRQN